MDDNEVLDIGFDPVSLTPREFEQEIQRFFAATGLGLKNLQVIHDEILKVPDGDYQMDVTATFEALGANFLVLIECKQHKHPIKREIVQALEGKLQSIGAQKGIICATGGFQTGAMRYAKQHGIALVHIVDGRAVYCTKSFGGPIALPPWGRPYVAQLNWLEEPPDETLHFCYSSEPDVDEWRQVFNLPE